MTHVGEAGAPLQVDPKRIPNVLANAVNFIVEYYAHQNARQGMNPWHGEILMMLAMLKALMYTDDNNNRGTWGP